jgi:hypothetical protein
MPVSPPFGDVKIISGKPTHGKTFSVLDGITPPDKVLTTNHPPFKFTDAVVTLDGNPLDTVKFDLNLVNSYGPADAGYPGYDTYTFDHGRRYDYYKTYMYQTPLKPLMLTKMQQAQYKKLFASYFGKDAEFTADEEAMPAADRTRQPFRYSKAKAQAYVDSMIFWLTNPFKEDILGCVETNS